MSPDLNSVGNVWTYLDAQTSASKTIEILAESSSGQKKWNSLSFFRQTKIDRFGDKGILECDGGQSYTTARPRCGYYQLTVLYGLGP
ncbi:hypothetical protein TNCV_2406871 [Trichonephila clavipes]|nr:hypothetical protein TNCV_2406871 [Trichonephila clavipes]